MLSSLALIECQRVNIPDVYPSALRYHLCFQAFSLQYIEEFRLQISCNTYFYLTLILLRLFQQHYCYNRTGQSQQSEGTYKSARIKEVNYKLHSFQARGVGMIFFMEGPNSNFFGASRHSMHFFRLLTEIT